MTDRETTLCCDAPINEQFSTCKECGEHVELRFEDGSTAHIVDGLIVDCPKVTHPAAYAAALALMMFVLTIFGMSVLLPDGRVTGWMSNDAGVTR